MRVRYTRRALGDLEAIYSYIAADNPKAARAVELVIRRTVDLPAHFPIGLTRPYTNGLLR
jgi:plasmid stabilization system protein ParE